MSDPRNDQYGAPWPGQPNGPGGYPGGFPTSPPPPGPMNPGGGPPAGAPGPSGPPPTAYGEQEFVVESAPPTSPGHYPATYQNAPDPFGEPGGASPREPERRSKKGWIIPIAGLLALAMIAAAVYFLFLQKDDGDDKASDDSSTSQSQDADRSGEASGAPSDSGSTTQPSAIAGSYDVNGTIESYSGPQTGQLGGTAKKAGDQAFKSPQTWTIAGDCVADKSCELTITPGDAKVPLTLQGDTWKGEAKEQIQCSAGGQATEATVTIEIPQAGGTAKRTVTATCAEAITEVDNLTLTKK